MFGIPIPAFFNGLPLFAGRCILRSPDLPFVSHTDDCKPGEQAVGSFIQSNHTEAFDSNAFDGLAQGGTGTTSLRDGILAVHWRSMYNIMEALPPKTLIDIDYHF